jgi:hypothetical protein
MIRRAFWLGAGAALGIMSYRRVSAIGRTVSGRVTGAPGARVTMRETIRFARDVREGMALYTARHQSPPASTLGTRDGARPREARHHDSPGHDRPGHDQHGHDQHGHDQKDGR